MIIVNGERIIVTPALIEWAKKEREKDEQRRKSYDEFAESLR